MFLRSLLILLLATCLLSTFCNGKKIGKPIKRGNSSAPKIDNVRKTPQVIIDTQAFGAKGDGLTNDTEAFIKAWKKACKTENAVLLVPRHKRYYVGPIKFHGPCKKGLRMMINGELRASKNISDYEQDRRHWLLFQNMENFTVEGVGSIDGNGEVWWKYSCKIDKTIPCNAKTLIAPTAMFFNNCTNVTVRNLEFKNPQKMHLTISKSEHVEVSRLRLTAPADSPNTDGIHVSGTKDIDIHHCYIETGDDCISIVNGSTNVRARYIHCGPGHGISIGSLGKNKEEDVVSNIYVHDATLRGTTNGLRIKSWQGGRGYAKNILFQDIEMVNVTNPIIIDQFYYDQEKPCKEQKEAVHVSNIMYKNIKGTSSTHTAVKLNCSKTVPCQGIQMENVDIRYLGDPTVKALCANVKYTTKGVAFPKCPSERPWAFLWN
uniref:endo-polygalacturonase n=1 Tax=Nicotiana tabacum TaxID=4097 RepID=A0A1S4D430_TOBAC|nr:PREDICTED: polygalacturonase-like isoform X1 [Nicotiana tabacum]